MVKKVWVANGPDFKWDLKFVTQLFEIRTNGCNFVKNNLKFRQKYPDFEWSDFRMVVTIGIAIAKGWPFEIRPSKSPDF